jgi:hypothetical protein
MSVTLYSTGCPLCKRLESMLVSKGINHNIVEGEDSILDLGYSSAPLLKIDSDDGDSSVYTFYKAQNWVQNFA